MFSDVKTEHGKVDVTEINPPAGFHFGALRFTPPALDGNNDQQSFLATDDVKGLIKLDVSNDKDKMIMLHVYNFQNADQNMQNGNNNDNNNNQGNTGNGDQMNNGNSNQSAAAIIQQIKDLENQINQLQQRILTLFSQLIGM